MQYTYKGAKRPLAMRNYGMVTLPVLAAMLLCGMLTAQASAKAVVGRRSVPDSGLRLYAPVPESQELQTAADDQKMLKAAAQLIQLLEGTSSRSVASKTEHEKDRKRLLGVLEELRERFQQDGAFLGANAVEHRTWTKRLETLMNDGSSMSDHGVLEARRRMGPEFNPTGW